MKTDKVNIRKEFVSTREAGYFPRTGAIALSGFSLYSARFAGRDPQDQAFMGANGVGSGRALGP
jgi:hypothetical protein